ncbi:MULTISPECIES: hypothetical protein [Novosphingobium]|uniref:hypothetical protein n=1 Tax=Novosphingobium TaxID=165696 RepID=UPI000D30F9C9|nr:MULTISPECIES: hypothetical protein [Novosphingobium]PTR07862.1 hypothetical protein C8K11_11373 [Novosphingobium sp. GV055]PUB00675.1 hypothetical protein C8K12_11373 [Novosphingobium sp. GV061]PUB16084.1 hypothetical protein C8K14_11373 [Novosphingobium sp. GV079]PUB39549.1 hypothetical protein C8K10_11373 [Novosphingobium sp. GV027]WQD93781.1 hypothetical protein U0041_04060 [Novosphingobium capsulatum]
MTLRKIAGEAFEGVTVTLDGCYFDGCSFDRCTLVFNGVAPFGYSGATPFRGCTVQLHETAAMVLSQLSSFVGQEGTLGFAAKAEYGLPLVLTLD